MTVISMNKFIQNQSIPIVPAENLIEKTTPHAHQSVKAAVQTTHPNPSSTTPFYNPQSIIPEPKSSVAVVLIYFAYVLYI